MNDVKKEDKASLDSEDLLPQPPPKRAPRGIRTFTVARQIDETGVSGIGVIIEGVEYATGQVVILNSHLLVYNFRNKDLQLGIILNSQTWRRDLLSNTLQELLKTYQNQGKVSLRS